MPEIPETKSHAQSLRTARVETLADGVFAIAMTLLVLNLAIPRGLSSGEIFPAIQNLWPEFAAYIVSFMVLAVYWIGHHNQFFWIKRSDRTFLWINVFFLMSIAFVPFTTSFLASYPREIMPVLIYGTNVILSGLALYIHWRYASGTGQLVEGYLDSALRQAMGRRILLGMLFYFASSLLAFVSTWISLVLFAALPLIYMRHSSIDDFLKSPESA